MPLTRIPARPNRIRVVLALLREQQKHLVEASLERANISSRRGKSAAVFELAVVEGRGIQILQQVSDADVVLFGLEDEVLPGEASHVLATYPDVKIVGVDQEGRARLVVGAVAEPLSRDLATVIRWISRRGENAGEAPRDPADAEQRRLP